MQQSYFSPFFFNEKKSKSKKKRRFIIPNKKRSPYLSFVKKKGKKKGKKRKKRKKVFLANKCVATFSRRSEASCALWLPRRRARLPFPSPRFPWVSLRLFGASAEAPSAVAAGLRRRMVRRDIHLANTFVCAPPAPCPPLFIPTVTRISV
jgi:hypothetical protein